MERPLDYTTRISGNIQPTHCLVKPVLEPIYSPALMISSAWNFSSLLSCLPLDMAVYYLHSGLSSPSLRHWSSPESLRLCLHRNEENPTLYHRASALSKGVVLSQGLSVQKKTSTLLLVLLSYHPFLIEPFAKICMQTVPSEGLSTSSPKSG